MTVNYLNKVQGLDSDFEFKLIYSSVKKIFDKLSVTNLNSVQVLDKFSREDSKIQE